MLLEPKEVTIRGPDEVDRKFVFSKFPAIAGREIAAKYPVAILPKIGDYDVSEATMLKLMGYVGVPRESGPLLLTTPELVNNHAHDAETLLKIEMGMLEYNYSFFGNGKSLAFFASIADTFKVWITQTLTDLSVASSAKARPRSKNSARSTR